MAELTYSLTEKQFCDAQRLHLSFKPRWVKAIFLLVGLAGVVLLATGLHQQKYGLAFAGFFYCLFPLLNFKSTSRLAGKLTMLLLSPLLLRTFRRSPSLHQRSHVELRDGQLHLQSDNGNGTLPWKHIIQWAEDGQSVLLYLQPRLFIIAPKGVDPQQHFITPLREQLRAHVGAPKT